MTAPDAPCATAEGRFGPIRVVTSHDAVAVLLNGQVQGSAFLTPSAKACGARRDGPGPVSHSAYSYGWLLAGLAYPRGSGVMVGLGSGVGAVQLLAHFPQMDLTVVEIDPVMVDVAMRTFPLLDHYCDRGQLDIVCADINDYLDRGNHFDFGMADAYDGGSSFRLITDYMQRLCSACDDLLVNAIDGPDGGHLFDIAVTCGEAGMPMRSVMEAMPPGQPRLAKSNYIMTSLPLDPKTVDAFVPFPDMEGATVDFARACWNRMLGTAVGLMT